MPPPPLPRARCLQLTAAQDLATTEAIYLKVVRGKTAALFSAATEVGGVIAEARPNRFAALFTYGDALGMAFQIVDDLLDYGGTDAAIGKNTGDDFRERKLTLPVIKAVAKADATRTRVLAAHHRKGRPARRRSGTGDGDHGPTRRHGRRTGRGAGMGGKGPQRACNFAQA